MEYQYYREKIKHLHQLKEKLDKDSRSALTKKISYHKNCIKEVINNKNVYVNKDNILIQQESNSLIIQLLGFKEKLIDSKKELNYQKENNLGLISFLWKIKCTGIKLTYLLSIFKFWLYINRYSILRYVFYIFIIWYMLTYPKEVVILLNSTFDYLELGSFRR